MHYRLVIFCCLLVGMLNSGCGRSLCRREPTPRGYGSGGPTYSLPPQNIPDGPIPPPPSGAPRSRSNRGAELLLPETAAPADRPKSEFLDPTSKSGETTPPPPAPSSKETINPDPPITKILKPTPQKASGISGFVSVKDGVTSGLRPEIEGLDWLKSKDYKTIVYLRAPSDDDTTDRRQAEKRDLKFVSWEITPEGINKSFVEEFNQLIGESNSRPIFVYGRDSNFVASIWYLHLRTAEFLTHDEAKLRASQLGLSNENNEYFKAAVKHTTP